MTNGEKWGSWDGQVSPLGYRRSPIPPIPFCGLLFPCALLRTVVLPKIASHK